MSANPRFLCYVASQGHADASVALAADALRYPGGKMTGFIVWIGQQWRDWRTATGWKGPIADRQHSDFDAWLNARTAQVPA